MRRDIASYRVGALSQNSDLQMAISEHFDSFDDIVTGADEFLTDVIEGLSRPSKTLPCKYFYDETGSKLFDQVCDVPEYYPARAETALMQASAHEMAKAIGSGAEVIEYGSGASKKVRILLDALEAPAAYVAVDISKEFLLQSTKSLALDYPALALHVLCADFTKPFDLPADVVASGRRAVGYFPGSTIGNFDRAAAKDFLSGCVHTLGVGGGMLVGVDLKKEKRILDAAYNDSQGVTEAFNLNLLVRINRELNGDFDLDQFEHVSFYNEDEGRIEMHLESKAEQQVALGGRLFDFKQGERIHTEYSYKYDIEGFRNLATAAGFTPVNAWTDEDQLFSVHFLEIR